MFGLDSAGGFVVFVIFFVFVLPFWLNLNLAVSRGKSIFLMLLLTLIFSWIVTLVLAFLPKADES